MPSVQSFFFPLLVFGGACTEPGKLLRELGTKGCASWDTLEWAGISVRIIFLLFYSFLTLPKKWPIMAIAQTRLLVERRAARMEN